MSVDVAFEGTEDVKAACRTVLPAGMSVLPLGLAFGVLVVHSGLAWWWAPTFAAVIFAGSLEFLLVGMIVAAAPLTQIAATALLVNFRHVFYALSFPLQRVSGLAVKLYSTFALTDEAYALTANPDAHRWNRRRIILVQAIFHIFWVASVAIGAAVGNWLSPRVTGLEFAVTALFVVLGLDAYRAYRSARLPLVAMGCAVLSAVLFGNSMLVAAMTLFVLVLLAGFAAARKGSVRA